MYFGRKVASWRSKSRDLCLERFYPSPTWVMKAWETTQDEMMIAGGLHVVVFNKMVVFTVFNHFKIDTFEASCLILWQVMVKWLYYKF